MATTACTAVSATLTGTSVNKKSATTAGTIVINTAPDYNILSLRITNDSTTASVALTLKEGVEYSGVGMSGATVTIGTDTTVVVGGAGFDSARFKSTADTLIITVPAAGTVSVEANLVK